MHVSLVAEEKKKGIGLQQQLKPQRVKTTGNEIKVNPITRLIKITAQINAPTRTTRAHSTNITIHILSNNNDISKQSRE